MVMLVASGPGALCRVDCRLSVIKPGKDILSVPVFTDLCFTCRMWFGIV